MKIVGTRGAALLALLVLSNGFSAHSISAMPGGDFYDEPGIRLLNQPVTEYRKRRAALMNGVKDGIVVVLGNVEEDNGIEARYRQNNWMAYLTGVRTPGAAVMLVPEGLPSLNGAREIVFIPPRDLKTERWTGVQLAPGDEAARGFGVERVLSTGDEFWEKLKEAAALPAFKNAQGQSAMKIYTIAPPRPRNGFVREYEFAERARKELPGVQFESVAVPLSEMRKAKSPSELALMDKAIEITIEGLKDVAANLKVGMWEYQVQSILEADFTRGGAERPGFPSIVGSGFYSTILHYSENHNRIESGDLVVCDVGAEYSLYTADITRTFPANGKFTSRQREVYQLVLDAQTAAAEGYRPGMTIHDLYNSAAGVMRKSPLRAKDTDGVEYTLDHFFIHGLSHYLGMDVHDVGDSTIPLKAGEVFTIEPGVYIQAEKLGVRIEDDYVVTADGKLRKMTATLPSAPDQIEQLMARGTRR
jgi:Xaa-Pro aminopeptidase